VKDTEERARAAMRAIAGTVEDAPPLRLRPAPDPVPAADELLLGERGAGPRSQDQNARPRSRVGNRRRRRSVLAPLAAAAVIAAVAVTLALIRDIPNGRLAVPASSAASPSPGNVTQGVTVPEYYVTWMQADAPYFIVGNTFTGKTVATVKAPAGVRLEAVWGAATDDRTFVVTGERSTAAGGGTVWYLLRVSPGGNPVVRLHTLPIPVSQVPAGAALSPDGTELAVTTLASPSTLRVYSASGALLHSWSAAGAISVEKLLPGSVQFPAMALRWSADGSAATAGGVSSYLGWANTDGTVIIGARVKDGKYQFGIFRGSEFTVLPILLPSLPTPAGLMNGTVAW
jgi:hypothetical protein